MEVGIGPGHMLGGDPATAKGAQPQFSANICWGQTAGWIKVPLGRDVCLGPWQHYTQLIPLFS